MIDKLVQFFGAVQADDRLLDNMGSALPMLTGPDRALCRGFLAFRAAAETGPLPELVDTDTAVAVIAANVRRVRDSARTMLALAALIVALVGLGLFLQPVTTWWWAVPLVGASGLAGSLFAVIRMRAETDWSARELDDEGV